MCAKTCGYCGGAPPATSANPVPSGDACTDVAPGDGSTCAQRVEWRSCQQSWMKEKGLCNRSCGRCTSALPPTPSTPPPAQTCFDKAPGDGTTCKQRVAWGSCKESWLREKGLCARSCGRCSVAPAGPPPSTASCADKAPSDGTSCAQRLAWGSCRCAHSACTVLLCAALHAVTAQRAELCYKSCVT